MTKKEILDIEKTNDDKIHLYKEGMFWIAYEKSAYRFITSVRPYRATRKFVQQVGEEMVSIGFPSAILDEINVEVLEKSERQITLQAPENEGATGKEFQAWKAQTALHIPRLQIKPNQVKTREVTREMSAPLPLPPVQQQSTITEKLRDFNLANKTPMECMMFVLDLKNSLGYEV